MKDSTVRPGKPSAQWVQDQLELANQRVLELTFRNQQLDLENQTLKQDNDELRAAAQMDSKTGVLTLEGFTRQTRTAIQHAFGRRAGAGHHEALAVLYVDLDDFGRINKEHGEPAGDACLRAVVAFFRRAIRDSDLIARNSRAADEFIIAFPNATTQDVVAIFARLHGESDRLGLTVRYRDRLIRLTMSGGLADFRPGESLKETIRRANLAMRHVKANLGKGRIEAYVDGVTPDAFPRRRQRPPATPAPKPRAGHAT